jgi:tetratricopeptide (TPR) repeat protein
MLFNRLAKSLGTVLFLLLTGLCVQARDSWVSVRSKHLLVIGNGSEKDIRQVATRLEQFREIVTQVFATSTPDSPVPTTVILFKDDVSYGPFKSNANNAGYFQPGQDVNYITLSTESRGDQDPFNIIFHEYTHLLVNNSFGKTPAWFNEGLAEFYSTLSVSNDQKLVVGRPIRRHIALLRKNSLLSLGSLLQVDYKSPHYNESDKQSIFYAESWALIHYLLLNKNWARAIQDLKYSPQSATNTALDESLKKSFGTSLESLESELRSYIQQDRFRATEISLNTKFEVKSSLVSSVVSEAELNAYLGDLLLHSNRAEAETYLQKALTQNPDLSQAHASLGMLRYRQGRVVEALASLERAIEGKSPNALVYYYYAAALSHPTQGDAKLTLGYAPEVATKARAALRQAIAIRKDFADSYNLLAYVNLVTSTDIDETIVLLNNALTTQPNRLDFRYMLGQLYMHKDDYKTARPLLEQIAASDLEAGVITHAQKLLSIITETEQLELRKAAARRARGLRPVDTEPSEGAASTHDDPSFDLRQVLRQPASDETQLQGLLQTIECDQTGLVFVVATKDRVLRLRADTFQHIRRVTYTTEVRGTITCGTRQPANPVVVCYVPTSDRRMKVDGVLSSLEFVPGDFSLTPPTKN